MTKQKQNAIEIKGNVGDEVVLTHNNNTLVVKIAPDGLFPDFQRSFIESIDKTKMYYFVIAVENYYHNSPGSEQRLKEVVASMRDSLFARYPKAKPATEKPEEK